MIQTRAFDVLHRDVPAARGRSATSQRRSDFGACILPPAPGTVL